MAQVSDTYIQKPVEVQALEVKWENETRIREFMREAFDQHNFQVVYVHNFEDDRWVEAHRNHFARVGISGRWSGDVEFYAIEGDWLVQARPGGRIEVIKPQEFRKLYASPEDYEKLHQKDDAEPPVVQEAEPA